MLMRRESTMYVCRGIVLTLDTVSSDVVAQGGVETCRVGDCQGSLLTDFFLF